MSMMENLQTTDVKMHLSRQPSAEIRDDNGAWTYNSGSDSSKVNSKEQIRSPDSALETSPEFRPTEQSEDLALKTLLSTSLSQYVCLGNSSCLLPVQVAERAPLLVDETGPHPFIMPPSSGTISMPLDVEQQVCQHLNFQLPSSFLSCPFANIHTHISEPQALLQSTDVPISQSSGITTSLRDPNFLLHVPSQPQSTGSPVTSLLPPATLLVPYPIVVPLPVPLPIPIPIQIPQNLVYTKTTRTSSRMNKSTQTLTTDSCCAKNKYYSTLPKNPQDEVLDLSTRKTQTRCERLSSASTNSALDLSQAVKYMEPLKPHDTKGQACHRQSARHKWSNNEANGNNISHSKFEAYNGRIVSSSQTVTVSVPATETGPANQRCFSRVCTIHSGTESDSRNDIVPQQSFGRPPKPHALHSEPHRQVLKDRLHIKRERSQDLHEDTVSVKKHLASFLPAKYL